MTFATLSDFQLSLAAAGAAGVAAVWAYNKWQEHRHRRQGDRAFRREHADALLDAANEGGEEKPAAGERVEPVILPLPEAEVATEVGAAPPPLELADAAIDCLVCLETPEPVAARVFWAAQRPLLGSLEGRLRWLGQDGGVWRQLNAGDASSYRRFTAALQLADRSGPLGEVEASKFLFGLRQLAEDFKAVVDLPGAPELLDRARALDDFCARVDWRIGINVVSRLERAFDGPKLRGLIESAGLVLRDDGVFHAEDAGGQTLFTVARQGGLPFVEEDPEAAPAQGITLAIDVPRVSDGAAAFDRLLAFAGQLMTAQDGVLVDDKRTPLDETVLQAIRAKIGEFQQNMAAQDIAAGGRRALRLYS